MSKKLFIIEKYIYAESVSEALSKESKHLPDSVFLDQDAKRELLRERTQQQEIGFIKNARTRSNK